MQNASGFSKSNFGFSLVEILVGLLIGLLATAVIMQVFATFEGDKRSTTGTADAQTNGTIALYNMQRDIQNAGFGLPVFDSSNSPFSCSPAPTIDHDKTASTPDIDLFPILITDSSGPAGSDSIAVRYGNTMNGGVSVGIQGGQPDNIYQVDTSLGCAVGDTVVIMKTPSCYLTTIPVGGLSSPGASPVTITLPVIPGSPSIKGNQYTLACLGIWNEYTYSVIDNQLNRSGGIDMTVTPPVPTKIAVPVVPDIVNIQAQYGISATASENKVTQWVDASGGTWSASSIINLPADRKRIKAIRVAIVSRNGAMQKENVSSKCSSTTATAPTGVCAWAGTVASPAPTIDLSSNNDWQRYRYRVYETIIPLKNVIWSRGAL